MKGAKFFGIRIASVACVLALIAFFSILCLGFGHLSYAQAIDSGPHATGLIVMTPEEADLFRRTHREVKAFAPNKIALERINASRAKKGLPLLPLGLAVPVGKELQPSGQEDAGVAYGEPLPVTVDNSNLKCFPPIGNQSGLGSCTTFATTYYQLTHTVGLIRHADNLDWDQKKPGYPHYDMIYSPRWTYNFQRNSENEGSPFWGNYDVLQYDGACTWQTFPYDGEDYSSWCTDSASWEEAIYQRIEPISYITDDRIDLIKEALNSGHVITYATYISSWKYTRIRDNRDATEDDPYVRKYVACWVGGQVGGHAMTIVGYNDTIWADVNGNKKIDTGELGAFRIANSWGDRWREDGFTWLAYDALKEVSSIPGAPTPADGRVPAIIERHVYVMTLKQNDSDTMIYTPKLLAEFTLTHPKRNQLLVHLGISGAGASEPDITWYPGVLKMTCGEYAFDGTIVLDFTDILLPEDVDKKYYLGVFDSKEGDPATLSSFLIRDNGTVVPGTLPSGPIDNCSEYAFATHEFNSGTGNYPPRAVITIDDHTPPSGDSPLTVNFSGLGSYDDKGSDLKYIWFFGDPGSHPMMAGDSNPITSHTYDDPGIYAARLSVTEYDAIFDTYGVTTSAVAIINVASGSLPAMHVKDFAMELETKGVNTKAVAIVTIVDALGFPVSEATVIGNWTGETNETDVSGVTDSEGVATIKSSAVKKPSLPFTFSVTDVTSEEFTYEPDDNEVNPTGSIGPAAPAPARSLANSLLLAYPSPGNPEIWIPYTLSEMENVVIIIYDASGRLVRKLDLGSKAAGVYVDKSRAAHWDGKNEAGERVSSGVYFYNFQAGEFTAIKKMVVAR